MVINQSLWLGLEQGIAPFRAFIEERKVTGARGKTGCFGDRSQKTDYLYGEEWDNYLKCGLLTNST